MQVEHW